MPGTTSTAGAVSYRGAPLFQPISAPSLTAAGYEPLKKFTLAREKYVRQVEERQKQPGGAELMPQSLKQAMDPELLDSLLFLDTFGEGVTTPAAVTVELIQKWIDAILGGTVSLTKADLDAEVRTLRMNSREKDPEQRVVQLFIRYHSLLRKFNQEDFTTSHAKEAVAHIVSRLHPAKLKARVSEDLAFEKKPLRKDFKGFFKYVKAEAIQCERYVTARRTKTTAADEAGGKPGATKTNKEKAPTKPPVKTPATRALPPCLNDECDGIHMLMDCPNTSAEKKQTLLRAHHDKKRAGVTTRSASRASESGKPSTLRRTRVVRDDSGLIPALLGDVISTAAMTDYGADDNVMSETAIKRLRAAGCNVTLADLYVQIKLKLTVKEVTVFARQKTTLTLTLQLEAGPLRMRKLTFLVLDDEFDEVILGRPLMNHLGIDGIGHLNKVREQHHDQDFSPVPSLAKGTKDTLARALHQAAHTPTAAPQPDVIPRIVHGALELSDDIPSAPAIPIGEDAPGDVEKMLETRIQLAESNGMSRTAAEELRTLVFEYSDVFGLKFGPQPVSAFPTMVVQIPQGVKPVRARARPMPRAKRSFIRAETAALSKYDMIYQNPSSFWSHPVHVVPKPGPAKFRMTVDLRQGNALQKQSAYPMPHLESQLNHLSGMRFFGTFDLLQGYWQLAYDPESAECQTFVTTDGIWTPRRVLHGNSNAVAHLHSCMDNMLLPLDNRVMAWFHDLLASAATESALLDVYRKFFNLCRSNRLILHAAMVDFFCTEVRWCGRLVSPAGVKYDPRQLQGLTDMQSPTTSAELQQFCCALGWMRTSIPEYTTLVQPLLDALEAVYAAANGKRTKRAVAGVPLKWSAELEASFTQCKAALAHSTRLAHRDESQRLCVYTDASERHWSSIVTQVPHADLELPHSDQRHQPLDFLSGTFSGAQSRWHIAEKEGYAIMATLERLDYLLRCPSGFSLFTDHRNLVYIYDPRGQRPGLAQHAEARLLRWALKLASYNYVIEFIDGADNLWADLLSRWAAPLLRLISRIFVAPVCVLEDFVWPTMSDLSAAQASAATPAPSTCSRSPSSQLLVFPSGAVWVPPDCLELQLRLLIVAHCGAAGHRTFAATKQSLAATFSWASRDADTRTFCDTCLHCISKTGGKRMPRPYGEAVHATRPKEVLHFDFLYIGKSAPGAAYLLLLKDDASGYVWLCAHVTPDSVATVTLLTQWFSTFNVVSTWCSDQGSHFKNAVVSGVSKALRTQQRFTVAYSPWSNGTIEVVCREVLRAIRSILSELQLPFKHWPSIVPMLQSILNNAPADRLNGVAPITAMTSLPAARPLLSIVSPVHTSTVLSLDAIKAERLRNIAKVQGALDMLHRSAAEAATHHRRRRHNTHNTKTHVTAPNFVEGDFVLVGALTHAHKLAVRWHGPRRVVAVLSDWLFRVEDLLTRHTTVVHASRLKFYHDASLGVTKELLPYAAHQQAGYEVSRLKNLRWSAANARHECLVSWRGFDDTEDTWEPVDVLHEDVPRLLARLLDRHPDRDLASRIREAL